MTAASSHLRAPAPRDPLAAFLVDSPYECLPGVAPDDGAKAILHAQQTMQRGGLGLRQDAAFRTLRDAPARVVWDLFTLGTTPGIPTAQWNDTAALLATGDRELAHRQWLTAVVGPASAESLQVRGVLATNELAQASQEVARAGLERALASFVGCWAALLARPDWLRAFGRARCSAWSRSGARIELDEADEAGLSERLARFASGLMTRATEHDDALLRRYRHEWDRERAAIEMSGRACATSSALPGGVARGLGPLGLSDLGQLDALAAALRPLAAGAASALPVGAVRDGLATLGHASGSTEGSAASALRLVYSPAFGTATSALWAGDGREAALRLAASRAPASAAPWFSSLDERARCEGALRLEIGLQRFREALADAEVPVPEVLASATQLIARAAPLGVADELRAAVETKVAGRTVACLEAQGIPKPGELRRVVAIATGTHDLLLPAGGGGIVAQALAQLRMRRAADIWRRCEGRPNDKDRHRVLQDLFQAAELAPHNPEVAQSIVAVVIQLQDHVHSAEGRALLEHANQVLTACERRAGAHAALRDSRARLDELLHPDAVWETIQDIIEGAPRPEGR